MIAHSQNVGDLIQWVDLSGVQGLQLYGELVEQEEGPQETIKNIRVGGNFKGPAATANLR